LTLFHLFFYLSSFKTKTTLSTGGVPASVLRQLSLALRQIGRHQANALEEVRRGEKRERVFPFF
jgi:hypothetical protein